MDIQAILKNATVNDNTIKLNCGDLPRDEYLKVADVIGRLGGGWVSRKKHFEFPYSAELCMRNYLKTGKLPEKNPLAFFPTPNKIIQDSLDLGSWVEDIRCFSDLRILEPSGGIGAAVDAILAINESHYITICELDENRALILKEKYAAYPRIEVLNIPFEGLTVDAKFDFVWMNPPFAVEGNSSIWIDHLRKAYEHLNNKGKLICVTPQFEDNSTKKYVEFKKWLNNNGFGVSRNDAKLFKDTAISTCTVYMDKAEASDKPYSNYLNYDVYMLIMHITNESSLYYEAKAGLSKIGFDWDKFAYDVAKSCRKENESLILRVNDAIISAVIEDLREELV